MPPNEAPIIDAKFRAVRPKEAFTYRSFGRSLNIVRWALIGGGAAFGLAATLACAALGIPL